MKRKITILAAALLVFVTSVVFVSAANKTTYKNINAEIRTKTLSSTTVKLSWKKHKADKYIIYKTVYNKNGSSKEKKIKTVSGKKTSAVIKAGKNEYMYLTIKGIRKNKNSKTIYYGDAICWTGMATPSWDDYLFAEGDCSPSSITIDFYSDGGLNPTGYQIYRKEAGTSKYKKIKTLKTNNKHIVWTDKNVKSGKGYYYKVRAYRKTGKKTVYSKKSKGFLRYAINFNGQYAVSTKTDDDSLTIKLTSSVNNGDTVFTMAELYYNYIQKGSAGDGYIARYYSTDGSNWIAITDQQKDIKLDPGKSLWIRTKKCTLEYDDQYGQDVFKTSVEYRGIPCYLDIWTYSSSAATYPDWEAIH